MEDLNEHVESCSLTTKNILTATMHMATKPGKVVTHNGGFPTVKSYEWCFDRVVLWDHVAKKNHYISIVAVPMTIKYDRMITYCQGLLLISSCDPLVRRFCKIPWQTITIISPLSQCLWPPNLSGWRHTMRSFQQ